MYLYLSCSAGGAFVDALREYAVRATSLCFVIVESFISYKSAICGLLPNLSTKVCVRGASSCK